MVPRIHGTLCGLLLAVPIVVSAADSGLVEWSAGRKLSRSDFKSPAPLPRGVSALSFVAIDAAWACENGLFEPHIRAVFDRARSAWRSAISNVLDASNARLSTISDRDVLQHEQVHFDIAELIARTIRRHFASLTDICTRPGGMIPLKAIVEDYQRTLDEEQSRYDRETLFGMDARMQSMWTSKIASDLKSGDRK
jgi:Bacterial protein of unknown function (DUF922)